PTPPPPPRPTLFPYTTLFRSLRWNWNTPIHVSRLEKGKVYVGAQFLFVTKDAGQSWQRISPDLTTNDPQKQKQEQSGGITVDNSDRKSTRLNSSHVAISYAVF